MLETRKISYRPDGVPGTVTAYFQRSDGPFAGPFGGGSAESAVSAMPEQPKVESGFVKSEHKSSSSSAPA